MRQDLLNILLKVYFCIVGVFCVGQAVRPIFEFILLPKDEEERKKSILIKRKNFFDFIDLDLIDAISIVVVGVPLLLVWALTGFWLSNNAIGICTTVSMIALMNIGSYQTAAMLLCGLFLYDIFWVFGTNVMVSVVRGFDAPIKIVWPRSGLIAPLLTHTSRSVSLSMLGLGDIAIPGFFISLMLHFDLYLERTEKKDDSIKVPTKCFYYHTSLISYTLALLTTFVAMHLSKHAQPALLYIVPFLLIASIGAAFFRGHLSLLWNFNDEEPEEEQEKVELPLWQKVLDFLGIWKPKKVRKNASAQAPEKSDESKKDQ